MINKRVSSNTVLLVIAWIAVLLASSLAIFVWHELVGSVPFWLSWLHGIGLLVIFGLTLFDSRFKVLRSFVLILLAIFFLGFGGGWSFGLIPYIRSSSVWVEWESQAPWAISAITTHLLRLTPALAILSFLLLSGRNRKDLFLTKGKIDAPVEPSRLLGMKKPEPWTRTGTIFAVVFASVTLIYLIISTMQASQAIVITLPLIPVVILIALINAFNEEFTLRAAPISELWNILGKQQTLMMTTLFFGLGHFYGVPSGILGVLLSSFLGWFLGKSMLETKGFFWAWLIHFLPDIFIFSFFTFSV